MKFTKKLSIVLAVISKRLTKARVPLLVSWSLTNRCNYHCEYCSIWSRASEELNTQQIKFIIDELYKCGTKAIAFNGGEPLLREDIKEIIDYCFQKGIFTKLTTNGSLVQEKIDAIKNINIVRLSFDGYPEVHDYQRHPGSYEQVIRAVKFLKMRNFKVGFNCVVTKLNVEHLDFVLKKAEQFKINVTFQPLEYRTNKNFITQNIPSESKFKQAFSMLISEKKRGNKHIANSLPVLEYLYNYSHYKQIKCWAGIFLCRILTDGSLVSCDRLLSNDNSFNCLKIDIKTAFQNLPAPQCINGCWRNNTMELNYLLSFSPFSILNLMNIF